MKVLLVVHKFFPLYRAGTEVLTLELARRLRERGHSVEIVAGEDHPPDSGPRGIALDDYEGLPVHRLHYSTAEAGDLIAFHVDAPNAVGLLLDTARRFRPDVVHFLHLIGFSAQAVPRIRAAGFPVVFTPTDYWTVCPFATLLHQHTGDVCAGPEDPAECLSCFLPIGKRTSRLLLQIAATPLARLHPKSRAVAGLPNRCADIIRAVNEADAILPATRFLAQVLALHGVDETRMKVIPYGVDIGMLPDKVSVPECFSEAEPLRLGFIGTLYKVKGAHVILDALASLDAKDARRVTLDIYGQIDPVDPYQQSLRTRAEQCGAEVRFRGVFEHERIGEVLRTFHALVVPSVWYESTPLVLCSALRARIPAVVSRLGGMTEAVADGVNGFTFAAGDAGDLAKIFLSMLDEPAALRNLLGKLEDPGRGTAAYAADVEAVYQERLGGAP